MIAVATEPNVVLHLASGPRRPARPKTRRGDGAQGRQPRLKVLIVEDELFAALHVESVLQHLGYEVAGIAANRATAVKAFQTERPDIVLMDINLGSGPDGLAVAEEIRDLGDTDIVFVTAYDDPRTESRIEARLPGCAIVSKPVTPEVLGHVLIRSATKRH